ncbi:zinc-dependent alcohol dehydrogenase [Oceanobacillus jeddahense]|uniref:Alcohol dehydrogenase catalytic domain-containing protein n=1 Tax=Oceanobacillus jeddahense TaxID=1462527 RepID=A0ABY5JUM6_9BACI|nr:alcohol dehydrogenase catalytic domain-containing protein [Oceanobacillus jeddahense]UUI02873.1 alcohol dehydrogenase catalytic domain-containing protein [Oceanobacillus jeddahense]
MKAVMKVAPGPGNVELKDISDVECKDNEVKINVKYSGICGTDLHILHDTFKNFPPVVLGHEFAGIVIETGKKVNSFNVGDRVTVLPSTAITCGLCEYCKQGQYVFCELRRGMGYGVNGSFTKNVVVREDMAYKIPDYISLEAAALAEPLACVVQALEELEKPNAGDTVLLSGPGPLGLVSLSLLINRGLHVIVAGTDVDGTRLELSKKMGASKVVNVSKENLSDIVKGHTNGKGVDFAVECAGHPSSINACLQQLKNKGKLVQLGIVGSEVTLDYDLVIYKQITLQGSVAHSMSTWDKVMKLFEQNTLDLNSLITHKFPLERWKEAFEMSENKQAGKVLLYHE